MRVTYVRKGHKPKAYTVNRASGVNMYAGMCLHGVTKAHTVTGTTRQRESYKTKDGKPANNITTDEYEDVLKETLLPDGSRMFTQQHSQHVWILQQDGDGVHNDAKEVVAAWSKGRSSTIEVLSPWPPNSPDLNPIENVWSWVDARVQAKGCKSFDEFKEAVFTEFKAVPKQMLNRLVHSMPKRLDLVLKAKGARIRY